MPLIHQLGSHIYQGVLGMVCTKYGAINTQSESIFYKVTLNPANTRRPNNVAQWSYFGYVLF